MRNIFYFYILIIITSCSHYPKEIEYALKLAGKNRPELEKVLAHYSKNPEDSLKYKAAVFLIENMPWHYSYKGEAVDYYYLSENLDLAFQLWNKYPWADNVPYDIFLNYLLPYKISWRRTLFYSKISKSCL